MPIGHANKIIRKVEAMRKPESVPDAPAGPSSADAPVPAAHTSTIDRAAASVGQASSSRRDEAHKLKVRPHEPPPLASRSYPLPPLQVKAWVNDLTKLNPEAPRPIYGRETSATVLSPHQEAMNAAAVELLEFDPHLVRSNLSKPEFGQTYLSQSDGGQPPN